MADQASMLDDIRGALQAGTASREYQKWASDMLWKRGKRIADLEAALASLVSAGADVETGRSVHNARRPGDLIEGPVWVAMTNALYDARTVLQKKPVTD